MAQLHITGVNGNAAYQHLTCQGVSSGLATNEHVAQLVREVTPTDSLMMTI